MRKAMALLLCCMIGMMLFAGCKKETSIDEVEVTPEVVEATLDQFAAPVTGDTVAEIIIRDYGSIYVRFFEDAAPKAVENFITLAKEGYYDGLTFHRIIEDFMLQGGDPTGTGSGGESIWGEDFKDEFSNDLQPYRGALCMANSGPDTNASQFFLVQASNTYNEDILDQVEDKYGIKFDDKARVVYANIGGTPWLFKMHTVFGQIYEGLDILDLVAKVEKTDEKKGIPATEVIIEKINVSVY